MLYIKNKQFINKKKKTLITHIIHKKIVEK